jgi:hypothetical protein
MRHDRLSVRLDSIIPGDVVRVSIRGRVFHAVVRGSDPAGLQIEPIERGITQRHAKARDIVEHWSKAGRPRAAGGRAVNPEQRSLDDLFDR